VQIDSTYLIGVNWPQRTLLKTVDDRSFLDALGVIDESGPERQKQVEAMKQFGLAVHAYQADEILRFRRIVLLGCEGRKGTAFWWWSRLLTSE